MKFSKILGIVFLALLPVAMLGSPATSQPAGSVPATGCQESAILPTQQVLNPGTGAFTQDRLILAGTDTQVELAAWVIRDAAVADPNAGAGNPGCLVSPDGLPTIVTKLVVKPVSGNPQSVGITQLEFWRDVNVDGFIQEGSDTQLSMPMDASCLNTAQGCVITSGAQPVIGVLTGVPAPVLSCAVGAPYCSAIIVRGIVGGTPQPGASLQIRLTAYASDLPSGLPPLIPVGTRSSDFAPQYNGVASSTRVVVQGGADGSIPGNVLTPSVNNGSGNAETGVMAVNVQGITTRDNRPALGGTTDRNAYPNDREYVVGIVQLCDGATPVNPTALILPPIAGAAPTIAGGLAALPCIPAGAPDAFTTNVLGIRVGVSGTGAQYVQAVRVYADLGAAGTTGWPAAAGRVAGTLFEQGEMVMSQIPVNGVAQIGSLQQVLTTSGGTLLTATNAGNFPALLYITMDIQSNAATSDVIVEVAVDTGDVRGGNISSRLSNAGPYKFNVHIQGTTPPPTTTATLVASVGKPPRRPSKTMTYKDVFVSATGPAGASKLLTGFSVPGCTVSKVTGPALPQNVVVGGAPVGPFKVKVKCPTKPASVPGLTPLRAGGESDVPGLIPLKAGSVGTIEIFTLTGKKVLETGFSGGALDATKLDLPNGVYLYVVKTITPEGVVRSELRKLVVKN